MASVSSFRTSAFCLLPFALTCALFSACGYGLEGRVVHLPDYVKVIGVPPFLNKSAVPDLDRVLAEKVRVELSGRKYRVEPGNTGDAVLHVTITGVFQTAVSFDANHQASRIRVTVAVNVEFVDTHTNKPLWSNPSMNYQEEYDVTTGTSVSDPKSFFGQNQTALDRLAENFARTVVVSMLSAF